VPTLIKGIKLLKVFELVSEHDKFPTKSNMRVWEAQRYRLKIQRSSLILSMPRAGQKVHRMGVDFH